MARSWRYTNLSLLSALFLSSSAGIMFFCRFCFVFVFMLSLEFPLYFAVQQTTYRVGNRVYYWVRLSALLVVGRGGLLTCGP